MATRRPRAFTTHGWDDRHAAAGAGDTSHHRVRRMAEFSAAELVVLQAKLEAWLAPEVSARRAAGAWVDPGERPEPTPRGPTRLPGPSLARGARPDPG